jgi:predicted N-acetyltransferase YhbS
VVLGHPEFYPRFGFAPAIRFGVRSEYNVPEETFMALELRAGSLGALRAWPSIMGRSNASHTLSARLEL